MPERGLPSSASNLLDSMTVSKSRRERERMRGGMGSIQKLVSLYRKEPKCKELEIRLGKIVEDRFVAGVTREEFSQLESDMQNCKDLEGEEGWSEVVDYHYTVKSQGSRTRVVFDTSKMGLETEHVSKSVVDHVVYKHSFDSGLAFKVALSNEDPIHDPPPVCIPTLVRIKQRRRFRDVRDGKLIWMYELSKTWSASSRSAVEHSQHVSPPNYEVECELVDEEGKYMSVKSDDFVARSISLKSQIMLGVDASDIVFDLWKS